MRRVAPDGATTQYYYDGIRPVWETDGGGAMTAQLDRDLFGNLLARREAAGTRFYYHPDGLGSTTALTDDTGAVAATMLYDAWGNVRANEGEVQGKYRYTGAERDETTGLYHMGARFYDPTVGRWLSEDPVQDREFEPWTLNFYAYVNGNPVTWVDMDGNIAIAVPNPAVLLGAGLVLIAVYIITQINQGINIHFSSGGARPQEIASGLMGAVAEHLAGIFGTSVAGKNPDPKKKPGSTTIEVWKQQIRGYLDQIVKRVGNDWRAIQRYLRSEGWTDEEIKQLLEYLRKAGIDPAEYFRNL